MAQTPDVFVLIMAGGGGTRLWPASTPDRPKHLLPLVEGDPRSLLEQTVDRAHGLTQPDRVFIVTAASLQPLIRADLPTLANAQIVAEPSGRNTAPCVALAILHIQKHLQSCGWSPTRIDHAVVVILPADHHIASPGAFIGHLRAAVSRATGDQNVVTLGITPDHPATGYGYIECAPEPLPAIGEDPGQSFRGLRFVEKPDTERAQAFVESGRFVWNAGLFIAPIQVLVQAFASHAPAIWEPLQALAASSSTLDAEGLCRVYPTIPSLPFDIAIMEKLAAFCVRPIEVGWSDLGAWDSVYEHAQHDRQGNAQLCSDSVAVDHLDSHGCLVVSEGLDVTTIGLRDVVVVATKTQILVCPRNRAQDVRTVAKRKAASS